MAIRNFRDVLSGSIIKSKKGKTYLCLVDETGNKALFDKEGKFSRVDLDSLCFGKNNSGEVDSIYQFQTLPILDAISEGLKYVFRPDRPDHPHHLFRLFRQGRRPGLSCHRQ